MRSVVFFIGKMGPRNNMAMMTMLRRQFMEHRALRIYVHLKLIGEDTMGGFKILELEV
jgi:hypothetical protein